MNTFFFNVYVLSYHFHMFFLVSNYFFNNLGAALIMSYHI